MDGLLKHWERLLEAMTPAERAEVARGLEALISGARVVFGRLKGGTRHFPMVLGWLARQHAAERSHSQFLEALEGKCRKAGPHMDEICLFLRRSEHEHAARRAG
jgi:hypothetical protein